MNSLSEFLFPTATIIVRLSLAGPTRTTLRKVTPRIYLKTRNYICCTVTIDTLNGYGLKWFGILCVYYEWEKFIPFAIRQEKQT